jgi:hypothetical protein
MMRYRVLIYCFAILLLSQLATWDTVQAQSGLSVKARAAFDGHFKFGEWLPVFVTVENAGPDLQGEFRASITGGGGELNYSLPAELPAGARKRFTLYVLPNSFSRSLEIKLVQGEDTLFSQEVSVARVFNDRYVIGLVAADPVDLEVLSLVDLPGRRERPEMISFPLEDLADRAEGLSLFNTLVFNDVDTSHLTPDQQNALTSWVSNGGRLILGGGAAAGRTFSGLPTELQPVMLNGQQEVGALSALETYADTPIRVPGPFLLATVQPVAGAKILLAQVEDPRSEAVRADDPLIIERSLGAGQVDFIALDLSQSPFNAWPGTTAFATRLLSPGAAWPNNLPSDISPVQMANSQMAYALTNLPALDLPSVRFLGFLLAGYILLVGPLNYFLLRWRDRLAWAWVTIPVLTLTFSGFSYGIGLRLRGSDIIVNQVSVMKLEDDDRVSRSRTYVGVFSPSRESYNIEVAGRNLIRPLGENYDPWSGGVSQGTMEVVQGNPTQVRGLSVNQWSMQSFVAETTVDQQSGLIGQVRPERDAIRGELRNQGQQTWRDILVFFNGQVQRIGDLGPGQRAEVALTFADQQLLQPKFGSWWLFEDQFNRPSPPNREAQFKQSVLDSVLFAGGVSGLQGGPVLVAWSDESPLTVSVRGREAASQKKTLLYGLLPLTFEGTEIALPPGFTQIEILETQGETGFCNERGHYLNRGSIEFRLALPDIVSGVQPDNLDFYITTDGGWPELPAVELYDHLEAAWVPLKDARLGANPIPEVDRYFDPPTNSIDVRVSQENFGAGGGCLYYELAMEGTRS